MDFSIEEVGEDRYDEMSDVICRTLRESSSKDYPAEVIDTICNVFRPDNMKNVFGGHYVVAAIREGVIVGTGCLCTNVVNPPYRIIGLFILPTEHGNGVGKRIMQVLEAKAKQNNYSCIELESSIAAAPFYNKLGYEYVTNELQLRGLRGDYYHMRKTL